MYTYVNDKKLTEAEWLVEHKKDVEDFRFDDFEETTYWMGNSYAEYVKEFTEQMAQQIATRDWLRKEYLRLMSVPFSREWAHKISDFNETFKDCFGVSTWFYDDMLAKKGVTRATVCAIWREDWGK